MQPASTGDWSSNESTRVIILEITRKRLEIEVTRDKKILISLRDAAVSVAGCLLIFLILSYDAIEWLVARRHKFFNLATPASFY